MNNSMRDHTPQWKTSAPVPSQLTEIRMTVDQLWNKAALATETLEKLNELVNTEYSQSRLLSIIKGIFGHSSSMPDFKGENTDHDQRYLQKSMLASISGIKKLNVKTSSEVTIVSGEISIVQSNYIVDTESGDASDDLDTINGGVDGDLLFLRPFHTYRTVVVKHGTGNIYSNAGTDLSLDSIEKMAVLFFNGTNWHLIS